MSWSASFTVEPGVSPEDMDFTLSNIDEVPEHLEQYREGLASAFGVLLSGVVGTNDKSYDVKLAGHGNEGHEPAEGFGNDWLLIQITQKEEAS